MTHFHMVVVATMWLVATTPCGCYHVLVGGNQTMWLLPCCGWWQPHATMWLSPSHLPQLRYWLWLPPWQEVANKTLRLYFRTGEKNIYHRIYNNIYMNVYPVHLSFHLWLLNISYFYYCFWDDMYIRSQFSAIVKKIEI